MGLKMIGRIKGLPRWQKWSLAIGLVVVCYTLIGFLILPAVVRLVAVSQLRQHLQREVSIAAVRMNPYTLTTTVQDMVVFEPDGKNRLAAFRELFVDLQTMSLFKWAPVFKEVRLDGLYASIILQKDQRWNFSDLLPAPATGDEPPPATVSSAEEPFRFSLNNIQLTRSEVHFQDDIRGKTHHVTDIDIALPFLSSLPAQTDIFVQPHFTATINGTPFNLQGQVKPFAGSRETELRLDLRGIDLAAYMPYVPPDADFIIQSGLLDINLSLLYESFHDGTQAFRTAGTLALHALDLTDAARRPLLSLDQLKIEIGALEPLEGIVTISEILLQGPTFTITRLPTDRVVRSSDALPLREVFRSVNLPPPVLKIAQVSLEDVRLQMQDLKSPPESVTDGKSDHTMIQIPRFTVGRALVDIDRQTVRIGDVAGQDGLFEIRRLGDGKLNLDIFLPPSDAPEPPPAEPVAPWQIDVQQVDLSGYAVNGVNLIPGDPIAVTVDEINLNVSDFSTRPDTQTTIALNCRINETGRLETRTVMTVEPSLKAEVQLGLEKVDLARFYPFIKPYIGVVLADGDLAIDGNLSLKTSAAAPPVMVYKGRAAITDFKTLDRLQAQPFVTWKTIDLTGLDIGVNPTYLTIDEIRVAQPFSRLLIDEAGQLNLAMATVLTPEETAESPDSEDASPTTPTAVAEPEDTPPVPINIGVIQGQGGKIIFADRSFKPGFQAVIESVETRITGLSTEAAEPAKVDIKGRVDGHAPVTISGAINPLAEDMYADLVFNFQQMDLTAASPYSGRYVGRTISQGKLSIKTAYHIENRALKADHDIMIDQFNFGEDVDSPDDMNLPVDLAVALLKDRSGEIHINLPVSGDMDDPEFSIAGIVLRAFVNLIVKAVTSPFALLGSMFEGEDMDQLAFEPGRARLTPATTEKLDALIKVLYDRPSLKLEISGYADPASDSPAYADILFQRKLQSQKALQLADDGQESVPLEDIVIAPEEYEEFLQAAYEAETFEKQTNLIGMEKTLPPAEAEALIRQHIEVTQTALEELAYARALVIKDYILDTQQVEPERVFLVKPENALAPEVAEGVVPGRVVLGLK
jgi:uncharacterized protein involved in outer membrane biogenesis